MTGVGGKGRRNTHGARGYVRADSVKNCASRKLTRARSKGWRLKTDLKGCETTSASSLEDSEGRYEHTRRIWGFEGDLEGTARTRQRQLRAD